jgi:glycerol-3-phosphate dehydrogenase
LAESVFAAFVVNDATIDPFRITLENVSHAQQLSNSQFLAHTQIESFDIHDGVVHGAVCKHTATGHKRRIVASQFVNAAGAWAKQVAALASCHDINMLYSKGTLIISNARITDRVVNRLRPAGDGDILVPGGTVSLLGTTSDTIDELTDIRPTVAEVERNLHEATVLVPALAKTRFIRAFSGVRPLLLEASATADDRQVSRGFKLFDHQAQGIANLATIAGGKLTTFRLMAEKTADLVAQRLNNSRPCKTATEVLPAADPARWTEPGFAPREWFRKQDPTDAILCECEMVPQSAVHSIIKSAPGIETEVNMQSIGVRSRVGKGSCQGSFCSIRINSWLYEQEIYRSRRGLLHTRHYVAERFKGIRPILWGEQMPQMELAEALHCGLMGLDLIEEETDTQT